MRHKFCMLFILVILLTGCESKKILTPSELFLMNVSNIQQTTKKENVNDKVIHYNRISSLSADLNEICKTEGINWNFEKDPTEIKPDRYIDSLMDCDWKYSIGSYSPHKIVLGGVSENKDGKLVKFYCGEKKGFIFSFLIIVTDSEISISRICRKGHLNGNISELDMKELLDSTSY